MHAINKRLKLICDLPVPEIPKTLGTLLVCGQGDMGQLGSGEDVLERSRPALVPTLEKENFVSICAGGMHSLCLTENGEIYSFGCNDEGALGRNTSQEGSELIPKKIDLSEQCVKISAGDSHSACLSVTGQVYAWGSFRNSHGSIGLTSTGNQSKPIQILPKIKCVDIASGADHLVILTNEGKVYTMGSGEQGQLGRVSLRSASGDSRRGMSIILSPDLVRIRNVKHVDAIWTTTYCTFLRKLNSNEIYAFGLNNYCQLSLNNPPKTELIITPTKTNFENIQKISGGQHHTLILTNNKKCFVIGRRDYGRLGLGNNLKEDITQLTEVTSLKGKNIIDISCGEAQSFAISENGQIYAWGMGSNQQLGTGAEDDVEEPMLIASKQTTNYIMIKVASGGQHSLFLRKFSNHNNNVENVKISNAVKKENRIATAAPVENKEKEDIIDTKVGVKTAAKKATATKSKRK